MCGSKVYFGEAGCSVKIRLAEQQSYRRIRVAKHQQETDQYMFHNTQNPSQRERIPPLFYAGRCQFRIRTRIRVVKYTYIVIEFSLFADIEIIPPLT